MSLSEEKFGHREGEYHVKTEIHRHRKKMTMWRWRQRLEFHRDYWKPGGLPCWLSSKESTCDAGDPGLIPGWGRSPGEGQDNPLKQFCLENPMDRAWWAPAHSAAESDTTEAAEHWTLEEAREDPLLDAWEGAWSCQYLDTRVQASGTVGESISVVLSQIICVCSSSHRKRQVFRVRLLEFESWFHSLMLWSWTSSFWNVSCLSFLIRKVGLKRIPSSHSH